MSFDFQKTNEYIKSHGKIARVLILKTFGSAPRDEGTTMLIWDSGQFGTIGGGELEYQVTRLAKKIIIDNKGSRIKKFSLGPDMGQCCGGAVELLIEILDETKVKFISVDDGFFARPVFKNEKSLNVQALIKSYRNKSVPIKTSFKDGWLFEPVTKEKELIWIYGAGHVGTAIANILSKLSQFSVTCIDTSQDRYPDNFPKTVEKLITKNPAQIVQYAPSETHHLILTYSHALDLEICHQLLQHNFATAGLIGSKTKWARFKKRLNELNYTFEQINRIICPIGEPSFGKSPYEIAIGVASMLLDKEKNIKLIKEA
ncbi:xanthine dehydrogenase accessory protein XdhC [Paracoccaceae bacterium]|jgi:xanthine dehydrogenase accessory factor|nr:xanthine dehydrogenase accessory protein XdhC [Paracoccaceae bacterium]MDC1254621.1 xanthine dehydrogenase accessory protein XdhC [Paracoccaceae bacterium]|tara:strand:+ start:2250 stop:3194 length:945 start_codon:yes stop_codon:yes gene_type:complete